MIGIKEANCYRKDQDLTPGFRARSVITDLNTGFAGLDQTYVSRSKGRPCLTSQSISIILASDLLNLLLAYGTFDGCCTYTGG